MNTMSYRGYSARVEFDDEDNVFVGKIAGIRDGVGFHSDTVKGLRTAFREAVDDYLATCEKIGKSPQKPYSGNVMFRVDPAVHANMARAAELAGKSLNEWAEEALSRAAEAMDVLGGRNRVAPVHVKHSTAGRDLVRESSKQAKAKMKGEWVPTKGDQRTAKSRIGASAPLRRGGGARRVARG